MMKTNEIDWYDDIHVARFIRKWKPILETVNIPEEYWWEVAIYCEKYQEGTFTTKFPALPISLRIISKLDLSKVMFTERNICKPIKIEFSLNYFELKEIQSQLGIDLIMSIESRMIEQMAIYLNEQIKSEGGIIINGLFEPKITEASNYKMQLTCHTLGFDVGRLKKLKKIRTMIRGKN